MRVFAALVLGTALIAPAPTFAAQAPKAAAPAAPVKGATVEGITEYRLANGLRVLLLPDASQPSITVNVTYLVGSRNETYGETGMAHLLEHLLFKGSDQHPDVPKLLNSLGATFNGSTAYDRTNYTSTFPAKDESLDAVLKLEADRMLNSHIWQQDLWDEAKQQGEMSVVRSEFEIGENNPFRSTMQHTLAVAFDWHNYGKPTIGARSDIEHVNIEHLQAFYHRYYQPDNAVLIVAGKLDEARTLGRINELFGALPRPTRVLEKQWTVEPTQDGERSVTVRRVGGVPLLVAGYHAPADSDPDGAAMELLSSILSATPGGRLHKALVETKLASQVGSQNFNTLEPDFYEFIAVLPKDGDAEKAKKAMLDTLEGVHEHPITQEELDRAKAEAAKSYELTATKTDLFSQVLSEAIADGDWRLYFINRDRDRDMTLAQVQAAAERYLQASNRTLGQYVPTEKPQRAEIPAPKDVASMVEGYEGRALEAQGEAFDASPANIEARTQRFSLPNGLKGALLPKKTKGAVVNVHLLLHFGQDATLRGLGAAPGLAADLLMRGTETLNRQQIQDRLDALKATVSISGGAENLSVSVLAVRDKLPEVLKLVAELVKRPSFPESEFQDLVQARLTGLQQRESDPQFLAVNAMQRLGDPYPAGHPRHALSAAESQAELKAATLAQVKAFHKAFYGAQSADFAAVGDFDPKATQELVTQLFGGWTAPKPYTRIPHQLKPAHGSEQSIETPDKPNALFIAGQSMALKDSDPDYPGMVMADFILGGGALKNRLADRLRQKEGLSYIVQSIFRADAREAVGGWTAVAVCAPQNMPRLEAAFQEELAKALKDGLSAEELAFAKQAWTQAAAVERTQDRDLASNLASNLFLDRTYAFDARLEEQVQALSIDQVNAVLRKRLDPAQLSIVKAGDFKGHPAPAAK